MSTRIKICGITRVEDAVTAVREGADTIGLNFWAGTKRRVDRDVARDIAREVQDAVEIVAVFVDADEASIRSTLDHTGITWVQLHGAEPPSFLERFLPRAYKALGVSAGESRESVTARVASYAGEHVLLDASVPGAMPGGTGHTFDWSIARAVATDSRRKLTLAGGLRPENVADAVRAVRPYRVDVASGVESSPGVKDPLRVRALIEAVRGASLG